MEVIGLVVRVAYAVVQCAGAVDKHVKRILRYTTPQDCRDSIRGASFMYTVIEELDSGNEVPVIR